MARKVDRERSERRASADAAERRDETRQSQSGERTSRTDSASVRASSVGVDIPSQSARNHAAMLGAPTAGSPSPMEMPTPRASDRPMESRGYGAEAQYHIHRATKDTATDPHDVPDPVLDVLSTGGGKSLDGSIQRALEDRMDADFSSVEIHTGPEASKAADAIDARAFTCGNAIVFNDGEYDPESPEGQHLLAHELAHVKQQTGAAISMMPQPDADLQIDPDPQLEREADQAAEEAISGEEPLIVNRMGTDVHIQRMPETEQLEQARQDADERFGSTIPADPEVLAKEVEQIKANQQQVLEVLSQAQPGAPAEGEWGETATKGLIGSLASMGTGAAVGAAVGSIFPGLGTAAGTAVGTAFSGVVGDLVKQGIGWTSDNLLDEKAANLEQMYEEISRMYEELKEGTNTGQTELRDL